ncbi:MAG TPA: chemotaxis protein CheX [Candidatus Acidoferrales bacterium]
MKSVNDLLASRDSHQNWTPLMELASKEVFELMLGAQLQPVKEDPSSPFDITAMVGLAGQLCGVLTLRCSRETAARMASRMLGTQPATDSQDVKDAFGEVGNMIAGNFKNKISGMADGCMLSVPTVITGTDYSVHSLADSDGVELRQMFDGCPFLITLQIHS